MEERNKESDGKKEEPLRPETKAREGLSESERIEMLRARLYERGTTPEASVRHSLREDRPQARVEGKTWKSEPNVSESSGLDGRIERLGAKAAALGGQLLTKRPRIPQNAPSMAAPRSNGYRMKLVLAGVVFFVVALGLASMFLFFGNNTISGENITISVSGPFAVGGGEEIPLQIAISNQNTIPIESATLIIDYPPGTQSATEPGKELFSERQQLNNIDSGEAVNVPIRAIVFGEENDEKVINVSVEYRVQGSNATFFKEAEPLRFKISSSPVVLSIDSVKSISSGQEAEITLTIASNSPTPLSDVLVKATYPFGFDYSESDPETVSGQDTWFIESLDPEEKETITIKGIVVGKQSEDRIFTFSVGVPNERDRFNLASVYTNAKTEISIEQPFLGVGVDINEDDSESVAIGIGDEAYVRVSFENSLDDTLYDGVITVELDGNALDEVDVEVQDGFYDSSTNVITWDSVDVGNLKELAPGRSTIVGFRLTPRSDIGRTPEVNLLVTVKAKRVFEDRVPQELIGTVSRSIRIASETSFTSTALYSDGPYLNTGPIPPVAERVTQYAILLAVRNGSNDITDAEVTATLPPYVTWLDLVTTGDDINYNSNSRSITWDIGDMDASAYEEAWVQISFLPSLTQVGTTPTLIEAQRLRATDRFTGTVLRDEAPALTTALLNDPDEETHDGNVQED